MGGSVGVTVVGGPTALVRFGEVRILVDPTFSAPGDYACEDGEVLRKTLPPALPPDRLGAVDLVLLSHDGHADNLDPAGRSYLSGAPLTVTTPQAAARLSAGYPGARIRGLSPWQMVQLAAGGQQVVVTAVPATHGPDAHLFADGSARPGVNPPPGEPVIGFVLRAEGLPTVYVSGDNASVATARGIAGRISRVGLAVLACGAELPGRSARRSRTEPTTGVPRPTAPRTLTGAAAVEVAALFGDPTVVPVHIDGWANLTEGEHDVEAAFAGVGKSRILRALVPGEEARL